MDLLFDWFGTSCMTTEIFCLYLQNRLIQTSQTGGQQYSDTFRFSIPCLIYWGRQTKTTLQLRGEGAEAAVMLYWTLEYLDPWKNFI
jgi:hypothetical protein